MEFSCSSLISVSIARVKYMLFASRALPTMKVVRAVRRELDSLERSGRGVTEN